jgi:DNA-binding NarL/FixJ family response regulator
MEDKIRILIADDQELIRESLKIVLGAQPDMEITDTACNGREVIRSVRAKKPDIALLDIRMPEMDGVTCTRIIKENYPEIKIIILTTFDDDEYVFSALRDGASGYLLKGISMEELIDAIHKVYSGTAMINEDIAGKVLNLFSRMAHNMHKIPVSESGVKELKPNEWKIIRLIGRGLSNKEISTELGFSAGTVRNYLSSILSKLALRDRTQLAIWALETGIVHGNQEEM